MVSVDDFERYGNLNYMYVLNAVARGSKRRQQELYQYEMPIAQQTALLANQQRDPKKQKRAFSLEDFSIYRPVEDRNLAAPKYGSAAVALIDKGTFPRWALFCYKDLAAQADKNYTPTVLSYQCDDAILLHPVGRGNGYAGMLIAQESASNRVRTMVNEHGQEIKVRIPKIDTKIVAEEGITLDLV